MAASQQQQQQQQQPAPWWAGPLNGVGAALQGVQHNLQQFAAGFGEQPTPKLGSLQQQQQPPQRQLLHTPAAHTSRAAPAFPAAAAAVAAAAAATTSSGGSRAAGSSAALQPVTKAELGRASWVFLHTLASQFPERPSRQQQRDARQLMESFSRMFPCADCAAHFQEILKRDPPDVATGPRFAAWMCRVHNAVNRRLDKPTFNCDLVGARWAPLDCDEHNSCDLTAGRRR